MAEGERKEAEKFGEDEKRQNHFSRRTGELEKQKRGTKEGRCCLSERTKRREGDGEGKRWGRRGGEKRAKCFIA